MKSPDKICREYCDRNVTITLRHFEKDHILIEGNSESLKFFGKLILAQADFEEDCGFHISPIGAGNAFFSKDSTLGVYIHRLPCENGYIDEKIISSE